jgi:hypothetical protein
MESVHHLANLYATSCSIRSMCPALRRKRRPMSAWSTPSARHFMIRRSTGAQFLRCRRHARARYLCVGDHSPDELWSAPKATGDLGLIDAVVHQAQNATLERPQ